MGECKMGLTVKEAAKEYAKCVDSSKGEESICVSDAEAFEDGAKWMQEIILEEIRDMTKIGYVKVPLFELREIANTLRIVANALNSPERATCLDRNVMHSWNYVVDMINGHKTTAVEGLKYYNEIGQTPENK